MRHHFTVRATVQMLRQSFSLNGGHVRQTIAHDFGVIALACAWKIGKKSAVRQIRSAFNHDFAHAHVGELEATSVAALENPAFKFIVWMGDSAASFNAEKFWMHSLAVHKHDIGLQASRFDIGRVLRFSFKRILFHKVDHCRTFDASVQDFSFIFLNIQQDKKTLGLSGRFGSVDFD